MADEMRIGDVDREKVVATLRTAFSEGRLDQTELDERLEQVYSAKTTGDLIPVTRDLPMRAPASATPATQTASFFKDNASVWVPPLGICVVVTVIWLATNPGGYFWPIWVYLGMGIAAGSALWSKYQGSE